MVYSRASVCTEKPRVLAVSEVMGPMEATFRVSVSSVKRFSGSRALKFLTVDELVKVTISASFYSRMETRASA